MAAVRTALGMLAAASLSAATTVVQLPRLPIECHSFNDVDSWAQLMRKGVHWFKLDIGMTVRESCGNYSTWGQPGRGSESDCFVSQNQGQEYCCMGLRGDASTRPFLLSPFNTTWDVLAWFSSPAAQAILPKTGSGQKIMMALDFGGAGIDFFNGAWQSRPLVCVIASSGGSVGTRLSLRACHTYRMQPRRARCCARSCCNRTTSSRPTTSASRSTTMPP